MGVLYESDPLGTQEAFNVIVIVIHLSYIILLRPVKYKTLKQVKRQNSRKKSSHSETVFEVDAEIRDHAIAKINIPSESFTVMKNGRTSTNIFFLKKCIKKLFKSKCIMNSTGKELQEKCENKSATRIIFTFFKLPFYLAEFS